MGNNAEQGPREIQPEVGSSKVFHPNTHALKTPPVIYEAGSVTGSNLRVSQVNITDLNNYIHTKTPKLQGGERYSRGEDYATEQAETLTVKPDEQDEEIRQVTKKRYQLKMDNPDGVSTQISVPHFDYDKKLTHFIKYPQRVKALVA